jgi:hypothetical protein
MKTMRNTVAAMTFWREEVTIEDLEQMSVRNGFILIMRSNLLGAIWTYKQLGEWFGVSTERIRQIEASALTKACWKKYGRCPTAYTEAKKWSQKRYRNWMAKKQREADA